MRLPKVPYDPPALIDFFQEALECQGALCERTWYDRLQVVAEGASARLWNPQGGMVELELRFPGLDQAGPRDAAAEVFPGCPLLFRLAESVAPGALQLQRVALQLPEPVQPPPGDVAEKLWRAQYPGTAHWRQETPFTPAWHFSLLFLTRCEVQAIDQYWSLHRLVFSLPGLDPDLGLAEALPYCQPASAFSQRIEWPELNPSQWTEPLRQALLEELREDLAAIRQRQAAYLRREMDRIDDYFSGYAEELKGRLRRQHSQANAAKLEQRLAAAKAEHLRRRDDQVQRHEIRVRSHLDALLLLAEPAWRVSLSTTSHSGQHLHQAHFIQRLRLWTELS